MRQAFASHQLGDGLVAIERTGRYHRIVQRTFAAAGFETRIVHPFVTKQYRQPVDPGNKTDDTDLAALHRATVTGCALLEATRDEAWTSLQLLQRISKWTRFLPTETVTPKSLIHASCWTAVFPKRWFVRSILCYGPTFLEGKRQA